ncbi:MAG: hypothetical protein ABUT20_11655 [Bacteroidota bacterium]
MCKAIGNETSLNTLVSGLLENYQSIAVRQNSFFINEIPEDFKLITGKENFSALLNDIFYTMTICSRDTCIRISAISEHNVLTLLVKDQSTFNSYAIHSKLQRLQQLAAKIEGSLSISSKNSKETTISFSFSNVVQDYAGYNRAA